MAQPNPSEKRARADDVMLKVALVKTVYMTGGDGFLGTLVVGALKKIGYRVVVYSGDILDAGALRSFVSQMPEGSDLLHFAAMSHPLDCVEKPGLAMSINVAGTALLLQVLSEGKVLPRIGFASTAQVYSQDDQVSAPISESAPVSPQNIYAQTKLWGERILEIWTREHSGSTTTFRIFNHVHKSQKTRVFLTQVYDQLLKIRDHNAASVVSVGNLDLVRDIGAVSDLVNALVSWVETKAEPGYNVFNLCSGQARTLKSLADLLAQRLKLNVEFRLDPSKVRQGEPRVLVGDNKSLSTRLGWKPKIVSDAQLVESFLEDL
jgi:GDP-4-dehydro-6-deoxy-D-mannose reductase